MSEQLDDIVENVKQPSSWIRLLFMLAFAVVLYLVLAPVILVIMVVQALFAILTGTPNSNLRYFSAALDKCIYQALRYLTYNSEERPFPFSDFPSVNAEDYQGDAEPAPARKPAPAEKAAAKAGTAKSSTGKTGAPKKSTAKKAPRKSPGKTAAKKDQPGSNGSGNGAAD